MNKTTHELFSELIQSKSLKTFANHNHDSLIVPHPLTYFNSIINKKNLSKSQIIQNTGLERTYAYHLLSEKKNMSRDKILIFSLAGMLSLEETNNFLKYSKVQILYARNPRDCIIIYSIMQKLSVLETNEILSDFNLDILK